MNELRWVFTPKANISPYLEGVFQNWLERQEKGKQIALTIREELERDKRISKVALGLFERVSLNQVKILYPKTLKALFLLAHQLISGKWGEFFEMEAKAISDRLITQDFWFPFLIATAKEPLEIPFKKLPKIKNIQTYFEGIYKNPPSLSQIPHLKELSLFFKKCLENISYPSHVLFEMMRSVGWNDALSPKLKEIKTEKERNLSLLEILHHLLAQNEVEKAMTTLEEMQEFIDVAEPIELVALPFLKDSPHSFEKILALINTLPTVEKRDQTLQAIALHLAKEGQEKLARHVTSFIETPEKKEFTFGVI